MTLHPTKDVIFLRLKNIICSSAFLVDLTTAGNLEDPKYQQREGDIFA